MTLEKLLELIESTAVKLEAQFEVKVKEVMDRLAELEKKFESHGHGVGKWQEDHCRPGGKLQEDHCRPGH